MAGVKRSMSNSPIPSQEMPHRCARLHLFRTGQGSWVLAPSSGQCWPQRSHWDWSVNVLCDATPVEQAESQSAFARELDPRLPVQQAWRPARPHIAGDCWMGSGWWVVPSVRDASGVLLDLARPCQRPRGLPGNAGWPQDMLVIITNVGE